MGPHELEEEEEGRAYCVRVPYDVVRTVHTLVVSAATGADATEHRDLKRFRGQAQDLAHRAPANCSPVESSSASCVGGPPAAARGPRRVPVSSPPRSPPSNIVAP